MLQTTVATSGRSEHVGALFEGYLRVGPLIKTICVTSDDGSKLFLDKILVIDNDGLHGPEKKCSSDIQEGLFALKLEFFEHTGGALCILEWGPNENDLTVVVAH